MNTAFTYCASLALPELSVLAKGVRLGNCQVRIQMGSRAGASCLPYQWHGEPVLTHDQQFYYLRVQKERFQFVSWGFGHERITSSPLSPVSSGLCVPLLWAVLPG